MYLSENHPLWKFLFTSNNPNWPVYDFTTIPNFYIIQLVVEDIIDKPKTNKNFLACFYFFPGAA